MALVGCCVPTFRPLFKSLLSKISSTVGSDYAASSAKTTEGTNPSSQSRYYYPQHDEEWPMTHVEGGLERKAPASNPSGPGLPQGRIFVQRELHSVTSVV